MKWWNLGELLIITAEIVAPSLVVLVVVVCRSRLLLNPKCPTPHIYLLNPPLENVNIIPLSDGRTLPQDIEVPLSAIS